MSVKFIFFQKMKAEDILHFSMDIDHSFTLEQQTSPVLVIYQKEPKWLCLVIMLN